MISFFCLSGIGSGCAGSSSGSSSSSVSSSCGGSSGSYIGGSSSSSSSCGGGSSYTPSINLPDKQVCIAPKDYHCDIYAWNLAIDNGLAPSVGNKNILDLNNHTVDTMYNTYYKDKVVAFDSSAAGKKGDFVI